MPQQNPKSIYPEEEDLDFEEGKEPQAKRPSFSSNPHSLSDMSNSAEVPIYVDDDASSEFDNP